MVQSVIPLPDLYIYIYIYIFDWCFFAFCWSCDVFVFKDSLLDMNPFGRQVRQDSPSVRSGFGNLVREAGLGLFYQPTLAIWMLNQNRGVYPPKWMVKIKENPIKMDDLGVPLFLETPISYGLVERVQLCSISASTVPMAEFLVGRTQSQKIKSWKKNPPGLLFFWSHFSRWFLSIFFGRGIIILDTIDFYSPTTKNQRYTIAEYPIGCMMLPQGRILGAVAMAGWWNWICRCPVGEG